jgi:hypothetical protein
VRNLSSQSAEPVLLEPLLEIEQLFESGGLDGFEDAALAGARSQLSRVINARKVDL